MTHLNQVWMLFPSGPCVNVSKFYTSYLHIPAHSLYGVLTATGYCHGDLDHHFVLGWVSLKKPATAILQVYRKRAKGGFCSWLS
jgi:hypothetical protein